MGQSVEGPVRTYNSSAALAQHRRVRLDGSGDVAYCASTSTDCIGSTEREVFAANKEVGVRHPKAGASQLRVASAGVAAYAPLFAAANGKVDDAGTVALNEIALEAATADGDLIEVASID